MKKCSKCHQLKNKSEFYSRKSSSDGLRSNCKSCMSKYRNSNKHRKKEFDRQYYLSYKDEKDAKSIEYYHAHKEEKAAYDKKNRCKVAAERRMRYSTDINYKLICNLRSRLYVALKRNTKSASTFDLLGCSIDAFKKHIESKFIGEMCWDKIMNGEIHIDHIKPCVSFNLTCPRQQKECFHYSNLQPLWAKDNFKKSKKFIGG